ncbi:MAG: hypothetical protein IKS37_00345 [Solobacterium sp.]|nr:hypothetical protein [Solobacterium sp.]
MEDFIKIEMYQCAWCGKIYRTDQRHQCKFRPSFRNCFSCEHCRSIKVINPQEGRYSEKRIECEVRGDIPVLALSVKDWKWDCPEWQLISGYTGKNTYSSRVHAKYLQEPEAHTAASEDDDDLPF